MEQYIGILTAMESEFNCVKNILHSEKVQTQNKYKIATGLYHDVPVIIIKSGVGIPKARRAAEFLVKNYTIKAVLNAGIAGAIKEGFSIGDVVIGNTVFSENHSIGKPDKELTDSIFNYCSEKNGAVHQGPVISVRKPVLSLKRKNDLFREFGAWAVDMEAWGVGEACANNNIPFAVIKTISDHADGSGWFEEDLFDRDGMLRVPKALALLLRHPAATISHLLSFKKNIKEALVSLETVMKLIMSKQ
ncbi:MAG: 5'-methylthioadenosine/S-adenosylhomocysteine nucleosidase [bacterium]|nr:5'-methylthioadenosine/S-adenosylhomocysteine nucleosidase [bacterium]